MYYNTILLLSLAGLGATSALPPRNVAGGSVSITPHEQYSSSIGVLGCKIETNRVAYWPGDVDCNNICIKVSANGRDVHLLKIDMSGGAYDISYDAWNYLYTGKGAKENPVYGGGIPATYENVPMTDPQCLALLKGSGGKLPLSAANSMNFYSKCADIKDLIPGPNWAKTNMALYNVATPTCSWGIDELCIPPDLANHFNQPNCTSGLGVQKDLGPLRVKNIKYGTGKEEAVVG